MRAVYALLFLSLTSAHANGQTVRVAVAANARVVLERLAELFKKDTKIVINLTSGSSGKLAAQIKQGAPFDIFLSADTVSTAALWRDGLAFSPPIDYIRGKLVVCSTEPISFSSWVAKCLRVAKLGGHIAVANPNLAPYGKAALECLKHYHIYDQVESALVFGESITQVHQYILNQSVKMAFTSASIFFGPAPSSMLYSITPDEGSYLPIKQGMVLLKHSKAAPNVEARRFFEFIMSNQAQRIFLEAGYSKAR